MPPTAITLRFFLHAALCAPMLTVGALAAAASANITNPWSPSTKLIPLYDPAHSPPTPTLDALPTRQSVSQYGITWTFDHPVRIGQFVNGDYYVVGPATVQSISPRPLYGAEIPEP